MNFFREINFGRKLILSDGFGLAHFDKIRFYA